VSVYRHPRLVLANSHFGCVRQCLFLILFPRCYMLPFRERRRVSHPWVSHWPIAAAVRLPLKVRRQAVGLRAGSRCVAWTGFLPFSSA